MEPKRCRHNPRRRKHIDSCVAQCLDCGMLHAMVVGRTGIYRKWVKADDPRVGEGRVVTEVMLDVAREHARTESEA